MTSKFDNAHKRVITGGAVYAVNAWHPAGYHSTKGGKRKTKRKSNKTKRKLRKTKSKRKK